LTIWVNSELVGTGLVDAPPPTCRNQWDNPDPVRQRKRPAACNAARNSASAFPCGVCQLVGLVFRVLHSACRCGAVLFVNFTICLRLVSVSRTMKTNIRDDCAHGCDAGDVADLVRSLKFRTHHAIAIAYASGNASNGKLQTGNTSTACTLRLRVLKLRTSLL